MAEDSTSEEATRQYYGSSDVDAFYALVWGGEDIHTGIYTDRREPIADASRRTLESLADRLADRLGPGKSVLDLGAGYGGTARYLADRFGCRVVALNLSDAQNQRHRETNRKSGADKLIEVVTGSFHDVPYPNGDFDAVCSLDSFLHSTDRARALDEAVRVLTRDGTLAFTDIMAAEDAPSALLDPAVSRLGVNALATPGFYRQHLADLGLECAFDDHSSQLTDHYIRLDEETRSRREELGAVISPGYLEGLEANLPLWIRAAGDGLLRWGIFSAHRPASGT